jgi:hypothetical protein
MYESQTPHPQLTGFSAAATQHKNAKRANKRRAVRQKIKDSEREVRQKMAMSSAIETNFSLDAVHVSQDTLTATPFPLRTDYPRTLDAVINGDPLSKLKGYRIIEWDGMYVFFSSLARSLPHSGSRTPMPIVDSNGMIYIHLAGRPLSDEFTAVTQKAYDAMDNAAKALKFKDSQRNSRRGPFVSLAVGVSSGNGNSVRPNKETFQNQRNLHSLQKPHMLRMSKSQVPVMQPLMENENICRISGYVNSESRTNKATREEGFHHPIFCWRYLSMDSLWASAQGYGTGQLCGAAYMVGEGEGAVLHLAQFAIPGNVWQTSW